MCLGALYWRQSGLRFGLTRSLVSRRVNWSRLSNLCPFASDDLIMFCLAFGQTSHLLPAIKTLYIKMEQSLKSGNSN